VKAGGGGVNVQRVLNEGREAVAVSYRDIANTSGKPGQINPTNEALAVCERLRNTCRGAIVQSILDRRSREDQCVKVQQKIDALEQELQNEMQKSTVKKNKKKQNIVSNGAALLELGDAIEKAKNDKRVLEGQLEDWNEQKIWNPENGGLLAICPQEKVSAFHKVRIFEVLSDFSDFFFPFCTEF
jgi:hypothetical protein